MNLSLNPGKKTELYLKKILSALIRILFKKQTREPKPPYNKILFLRYDVLGDMIVSLPVLRACRKQLSSAEIDIICSRKNEDIIKFSGYVNNTYITTKSFLKNLGLVFALRKKKYDVIINLVTRPSLTYGILAYLIGKNSVRVAGDQDKYEFFYTHNVLLPHKREIHMAHRLMLLCSFITEEKEAAYRQPWVEFDAEVKKNALGLYREICRSISPEKEKLKIAAVNLSSGLERRNWPLEKYSEFLSEVSSKYDNEIDGWVVITNPATPGHSKTVVDKTNKKNVIVLPVINDFKILFEFLRHLYLLITPDTSILHAASATGTAVLAMIIGENQNTWSPIGNINEIVFSKDLLSLEKLSIGEVTAGLDLLIKKLR